MTLGEVKKSDANVKYCIAKKLFTVQFSLTGKRGAFAPHAKEN